MQNWFWIIIIGCILILGGLLGLIEKQRTPRVVRYSGIALIAIGLGASLVLPLFLKTLDEAETSYLRNAFLIIASIGANLVAASVLLPISNVGGPSCNHSLPSQRGRFWTRLRFFGRKVK